MKVTEYKEEGNLNSWMDNVVTNSALPDNKGKITTIQEPQKTNTKYGERYYCQFVIEGEDGSVINTKVFLPENFPYIHPKSNMGKILDKYGCKKFSELIGTEVKVYEKSAGLWNIEV